MKANRTTRLNPDDRAEAGIGTMIVFIALTLVAAIAAGVMIDTGGKMQEKAKRTGTEASQLVASNLQVVQIQGRRTASSDVLDLNISVGLAPGGDRMDLSQLRIQISNATTYKSLGHTTAVAGSSNFNVTKIRDADGSFSAGTPGMNTGDLFSINIALDDNALELAARGSLSILLIPESGTPVRADVKAPPSYGVATVVDLR